VTFFVYKKPGISDEEFANCWSKVHAPKTVTVIYAGLSILSFCPAYDVPCSTAIWAATHH
jgi:hypothetical protein